MPGDDAGAKAFVAIKSDEIRIWAKEGMKIVVDKGDIYVKAGGKLKVETDDEITIKTPKLLKLDAGSLQNPMELGGGGEAAANGETLVAALGELAQALSTDIRPSAMGPVAPAGSMAKFIEIMIKCQLPAPASQLLSSAVKIKK